MMFPSAVQGHMPFVDSYKEEQIRKVVEKHRSRHHSGPDAHSSGGAGSAKRRNTHSMPILWQSVYAGQRPKFISMPSLDEQRAYQVQPAQPKGDKARKSFLSSIKRLLGGKKEERASQAPAAPSGAASYPHGGKKPASGPDYAAGASGVQSPKRQRLRTISNKSAVMETIEEVSEALASADTLSSHRGSVDGDGSRECLRRVSSTPETSGVLYNCANMSGQSDSSPSSHHGSSELICAM